MFLIVVLESMPNEMAPPPTGWLSVVSVWDLFASNVAPSMSKTPKLAIAPPSYFAVLFLNTVPDLTISVPGFSTPFFGLLVERAPPIPSTLFIIFSTKEFSSKTRVSPWGMR